MLKEVVTYNIGGYGAMGSLEKELNEIIIDNHKYDFLASFNQRFWFEGKMRFLSLISLPGPKNFTPAALDHYDTLLIIYDPSIEPAFHREYVRK